MNNQVNFMGYDCEIIFNVFQFNQMICINLIGANTALNKKNSVFRGEPISRLSVCIDDFTPEAHQTLIRTDNGVSDGLTCLIDAGIVSEPIAFFNTGHILKGAALVDILIDVNKEL